MEKPEQLHVPGSFEKARLFGGDHFTVEDLLDFSNEDEDDGDEQPPVHWAVQTSAESSTAVTPADCASTSPLSAADPHFLAEEICVPLQCEEEVAQLEWLSHFVEDSFSNDSSSHPLPPSTAAANAMTATMISTNAQSSITTATITRDDDLYITTPPSPPHFSTDPPVRSARSKRSRAAPSNWASRLLLVTPCPLSPEASLLSPPSPGSTTPPPSKKHSKAPKKLHSPLEPSIAPNPDGRKCLHCATDKTPQWRTGPMGPKTLCNACGVRYKSGRLVPEYRPAASPTFVLSEHSNSHRKVMELRRQKELMFQQQQHNGNNNMGNDVFLGHYQQQLGGGYYDSGDEFLIHNHLGPDFRQLI